MRDLEFESGFENRLHLILYQRVFCSPSVNTGCTWFLDLGEATYICPVFFGVPPSVGTDHEGGAPSLPRQSHGKCASRFFHGRTHGFWEPSAVEPAQPACRAASTVPEVQTLVAP